MYFLSGINETLQRKQTNRMVQKQTLLSSCEHFLGWNQTMTCSWQAYGDLPLQVLFCEYIRKSFALLKTQSSVQETEGELDLDQVLQEEFIARNQTYTRGPNRSCGKWVQLARVWGERWGRPSPCDRCPAGGAARQGTPWTPGIWGPGSVSAADVDSEPREQTDPRLRSQEPQMMMIRPRPEERDWSWLQSSHYSSGVNADLSSSLWECMSVCPTCSADAVSSVSLSAVDELSLLLEAAAEELPLSAADELDSAWWPRFLTMKSWGAGAKCA